MQSYWTAQAVFKEVSDWLAPPKEKLVRLIMAMTCVENGIKWEEVDKDAIWQGYDLAFPGVRKVDKNVVWDEYWDWSPLAYGEW